MHLARRKAFRSFASDGFAFGRALSCGRLILSIFTTDCELRYSGLGRVQHVHYSKINITISKRSAKCFLAP